MGRGVGETEIIRISSGVPPLNITLQRVSYKEKKKSHLAIKLID